MKVVPLGEKVVVKRLESEETTTGGIVLPDTARERPQQGRVLSVGDGRLLGNGDRVGHQVSEGDERRQYTPPPRPHVPGASPPVMTSPSIRAVLSTPSQKMTRPCSSASMVTLSG